MRTPKLIALLGLLSPALGGWAAGPLDTWTWRNPLPQGNPLHAITYGNGTFVAVGWNGAIVTSTNGAKWVSRPSGTAKPLLGIASGNGMFVAVGWNGAIVTSADGVTWLSRQFGTVWTLYGIASGNGTFVAVDNGGNILQSGGTITLGVTTDTATGRPALSLSGPVGLPYTVQASPDLATWRNVTNFVTAAPTNTVLNPIPTGAPRLSYRAYSQ